MLKKAKVRENQKYSVFEKTFGLVWKIKLLQDPHRRKSTLRTQK